MSIIKNDIPILEFDSEKTAVIMPTHEKLDISLPRKAVFAFLGDKIDEYVKKAGGKKVGAFISATGEFPVYIIDHRGEEICLCKAPVGSAAAAQLLDWLIGYGVRHVLSAGSCGALKAFPENIFLVPQKALRDEGTSYHYIPPSRYVQIDERAKAAIKKGLESYRIEYRETVTWSTDGFYRETPDKVKYRVDEGCEVVEMECSALAAVAKLRGAVWGCILYTADTLAHPEKYAERDWGQSSTDLALKICLDSVIEIKE